MFTIVVLKRIAAWWRYRSNLHELAELTDRELADVGLCRSNLEYAARAGDEHWRRDRSPNRARDRE